MPPGAFVEPGPHSESPERVRRIRSLVEVSGLGEQLVQLRPRAAERDELLRLHTPAYLERVAELSAAGHGDAGFFSPVGPVHLRDRGRSPPAPVSRRSTPCSRASSTTPTRSSGRPGHHALAEHGMGGCIFGNTALAAMHAQAAHGIERVAVIDWDAHHGNGTQAAFWDDPSVLHDLAAPGRLLPARLGRGRRARRRRARGGRTSTSRCLPAPASAPSRRRSSASCSPCSIASGPVSC